MGLQESRGKLAGGMRDLMAIWANTKIYWNDANSDKIEETFLRPLEMDLRATASAMDGMSALLSQIRAQCE